MEYVTIPVVPDDGGHWKYLQRGAEGAHKVGVETRGAWPRPVACRLEGLDLMWQSLEGRAGQVTAACQAALEQGRLPVKSLRPLIAAVSPDSVAVRLAIRLGPLGIGAPDEWVRTTVVWPGPEVLERLAAAARRLPRDTSGILNG